MSIHWFFFFLMSGVHPNRLLYPPSWKRDTELGAKIVTLITNNIRRRRYFDFE